MLLLFCERLGGFKTPKPTPTTALDFFSLLWSNSAVKINTMYIPDLLVFGISFQ